jgi:hypothetical protein
MMNLLALLLTVSLSLNLPGFKTGKDHQKKTSFDYELNEDPPFYLKKAAIGRDPFAGVYAIWYGYDQTNETVLNSKYLKGGQTVVQWKDCEPSEGVYDFSLLNTRIAALAARGLKTTVQINGNSKPDYLFDKVPYLPRKVHVQVADEKGSLMYWHPYFTRAYLNFLSAYARFMKNSPYLDMVTGVRQNYCMFGNEIGLIEGLYDLKVSDWIIPPGVEYVKASPAQTSQFKEKVIEQHVKEFIPEVRVLFRAGVDDAFIQENIALFESGLAGFFETGAAMEQNQRYSQEWRYSTYIKYCKPGIAVGFSELISGRLRPYSEIQWQYWRVLSELHSGISYIGTRPLPFEKAHLENDTRYINVLEFADKYAGYHALPAESPGAWIALRGKGDSFPWDYTFLMESLDSSSLTDLKRVGSDEDPYGAWAQNLAVGGRILLDIHDDFYSADQRSVGVKATLRVIYYDSGKGSWTLKYDASGDPAKIARVITNRNTKKWIILDIPVNDGYFDNRSLDKADMVIENTDAGDLVVHMVELVR